MGSWVWAGLKIKISHWQSVQWALGEADRTIQWYHQRNGLNYPTLGLPHGHSMAASCFQAAILSYWHPTWGRAFSGAIHRRATKFFFLESSANISLISLPGSGLCLILEPTSATRLCWLAWVHLWKERSSARGGVDAWIIAILLAKRKRNGC